MEIIRNRTYVENLNRTLKWKNIKNNNVQLEKHGEKKMLKNITEICRKHENKNNV
jgi:hypothetical protein